MRRIALRVFNPGYIYVHKDVEISYSLRKRLRYEIRTMLEIVLTIDSCGHQVSIAEIDSIGSFSSTILQGNLSPGNVGYVLGDNVSPLLVQILPGVFMGQLVKNRLARCLATVVLPVDSGPVITIFLLKYGRTGPGRKL